VAPETEAAETALPDDEPSDARSGGFKDRLIGRVDGWQRRHPVGGVTYGTVRKFSDDQANLYVVSLGWYGFTAIYPLLLVVVTILGYIGVENLSKTLVKTLHEFPVIGSEIHPSNGGSTLHGSPVALVIGLVLTLYGAQGVTQIAQQTMAKVWGVPQAELPSFFPRLLRSLAGLSVIGIAFVADAYASSLATASSHPFWFRVAILAGLLAFNVVAYLASFLILTASPLATYSRLVPGAILGGVGFTFLTTIGTGLVQHQLRNTSATYGALASVIGVVVYLLLLAKVSVYAAELNPVLARRLWPRSIPGTPPTEADLEVQRELVHAQKQRSDTHIDVTFAPEQGGAAAGSEEPHRPAPRGHAA
jgi:uncharacterized BrkB/YihY/UPF0761 family membrane protein